MENKGEIIIYESTDGLTKIDVKMDDETADSGYYYITQPSFRSVT